MIRRRLVAIATLGAALALLPLTGVFAVVLTHVLHRDARALLENRADAAAATVDVSGGTLQPRETASDAVLDTNTWIFDLTGRVVERPSGSTAGDATAVRLQRERRYHDAVAQGGLLLMAVPVGSPQRPDGVVVAALSQKPYRDAGWTALCAAAVLDLIGLAVVALAAHRTVSATLAPVTVMTAQAAEWGAHDVHRRFTTGRRGDELAGLAATMNGLLARLAASLGHERRLTAEIAHELRTPLARMRVAAETALRAGTPEEQRNALSSVVADTAALADVIDTLLRVADRPDAGASSTVADLVQAVVQTAPAGSVCIKTRVRPGLPDLGVDLPVGVRVLAPVIENAVRYSASWVRIDAYRREGHVVIAVHDDGPGFAAQELQEVFAPGARGRAAALAPEGAGLGLSLSRRLARDADGDVRAVAFEGGGVVEIELPAVE